MEGTRIFYVDDQLGDDANSGLQKECAWRSIGKINEMTFYEGDSILLKRGGHFTGCLHPKGSGSREAVITLGAYGEGALPQIDGCGCYAGIWLEGVDYWTVRELCVKNTAKDRKVRQGICISGRPEGITRGIVIRDCEITEVMGENRRDRAPYESMYWNGGIYVTMPGRSSKDNHLHDILIADNHIHDVDTSGIRINQQEDFINDIHHTHIVVRHNKIARTGSDGIIVANCISPLIDGNICFHAGARGTPEDTRLIAGIWVCATSNALIQRNEVAYTRLFENDGTAFDTDWGTAGDTIIQYNYTHDNEGGFWLDCMKLNYNKDCASTILRYNISVRDGRGIGVYDQGVPVEFYGNLFYFEAPFLICCFDEGEHYRFCHNVFVYDTMPSAGFQKASYHGTVFLHRKTAASSPEDRFSLKHLHALLEDRTEEEKESHTAALFEALCALVKEGGRGGELCYFQTDK